MITVFDGLPIRGGVGPNSFAPTFGKASSASVEATNVILWLLT